MTPDPARRPKKWVDVFRVFRHFSSPRLLSFSCTTHLSFPRNRFYLIFLFSQVQHVPRCSTQYSSHLERIMRVKRYLAFLKSSSRSDARIIRRVQRISLEKLVAKLRPFSSSNCSTILEFRSEKPDSSLAYIDVVFN